jgi:hypothetical protein
VQKITGEPTTRAMPVAFDALARDHFVVDRGKAQNRGVPE